MPIHHESEDHIRHSQSIGSHYRGGLSLEVSIWGPAINLPNIVIFLPLHDRLRHFDDPQMSFGETICDDLCDDLKR